MNKLPTELVIFLKDFLTSNDYSSLLNTSKALFQQVKRDHGYLSLTATSSHRFLQDESFRMQVLQTVKDPCRQIALWIWGPDIDFAAHSESFTVHQVTITRLDRDRTHAIPYLPHISVLASWNHSHDVVNCSHLKSLHCMLSSSVVDISSLANIPDLHILSGEGLTEETFSLLGKQKILELSVCPALTNVANFNNIHQLTLRSCHNLQDISPLRGIRELELWNCPQISDISCLGDHYKLRIVSCAYKLNGYHILRNIPIVHLTECNISDLSVLQYAREVTLCGCNEAKDVSYLINARTVHLRNCLQITDISCLNGARDLQIGNLPALTTGITAMKKHCTFTLGVEQTDNENTVKTILFRCGIHKLYLVHVFIEDNKLWTQLSYLRSLGIFLVETDFSLKGLSHIPILRIVLCKQLTSLEGLGNNQSVEISYCPLITDVSYLKDVPMVKIKSCPGIKDYSCLREVPRLTVITE